MARVNPKAHVTATQPLCLYDRRPCRRKGKAVWGRIRLWADGKGYQRTIACTRCRNKGEQSASLGRAGLLLPAGFFK